MHLHHEALLTLARKVYAAAGDGDPKRLEQAAGLFLDALSTHVGDEAVAMTQLSPGDARILRRGHGRLLTIAAELTANGANGCLGVPQRCASRAEELLALLVLQARDEQRVWPDAAA